MHRNVRVLHRIDPRQKDRSHQIFCQYVSFILCIHYFCYQKRPKNVILNAVLAFPESNIREVILISQLDFDNVETAGFMRTGLTANARWGPFFSKTTSQSGDWTFDEGVWSFRWASGQRFMEFLQKDPLSELDWQCDGYLCELNVSGIERSSRNLPAWVISMDPEELRLLLIRKKRERALQIQLEEGKARGAIAAYYKECPLCFFELHLYPVAILRYQSKRSCPHYLHAICANAYKTRLEVRNRTVACPVCYKKFTEVKTLPKLLEDPRMWFQLCDADLTGTLDKQEVLEGLVSVLPVERERLEKAIDENWSIWDPDGDGVIALSEFTHPLTGLKSFLVQNYNIFRKERESNHTEIPALDSNPKEWFDYWDNNRNATLERMELGRALIKTFCVTAWGDPIIKRSLDISELAMNLWDTLGYKPREKISFTEFMKPFGIADQVIHNNVHGQFFGENE